VCGFFPRKEKSRANHRKKCRKSEKTGFNISPLRIKMAVNMVLAEENQIKNIMA